MRISDWSSDVCSSDLAFLHQGVDEETESQLGAPPSGHGLLGELITAGGPIRLDDIRADRRFGGFPAHHPEMRTFLGVPVASRRRAYGNLYLGDKDGRPPFDETAAPRPDTLAALPAAPPANRPPPHAIR